MSLSADRLNSLLAERLFPLTCHQLRGGMYRDDALARTPAQSCVIAPTIDQIGSRLLFRAYGRSPKVWGLQAGLAGNDSLIILDEAHCANPFYQTMKAVSSYREWRDERVGGPFQFVIMSATPPDGVEPISLRMLCIGTGRSHTRNTGRLINCRSSVAIPLNLVTLRQPGPQPVVNLC